MTSRSRARARARRPASRRIPWVWIVLGVVVVLAAVIAVAVSGGNESTPTDVAQTRPVEVTGSALPPLPDTGADPAVGQAAPELRGRAFDGTPVTITHAGGAKLVLFVAHWCPHCQREVPLLSGYLASHSLPKGLELLTVATGTNLDRPNYPPSDWLERENWPAPVLADDAKSSAAIAYGLPGYPYLVAVSASGNVVARISGEFSIARFLALAKAARAA